MNYRVDSPAGSARISEAGEYRLGLLHSETDTQLELAVVRGTGEIVTEQGTTPVRAGERANASDGLAPLVPLRLQLGRWRRIRSVVRVAARPGRGGVGLGAVSAGRHAGLCVVVAADGDWRYAPRYGYVWYPRVAVDWRPYYHGRWVAYPDYGWTWVGADRFAWPTHHYGRWGFSAGVWFWIPDARWAPAYVSWGYAPGYVSWCRSASTIVRSSASIASMAVRDMPGRSSLNRPSAAARCMSGR